ncbi:hypothetical protein [Rhodopseudomonas palustris]|uniref:hypothetical protein n=1 Tax=Rhodopseudomonas palustris TaxID=1076 RepID=UPI0011C42135|nr:hypothetical protein [Rhodopseudomonas palustris]
MAETSEQVKERAKRILVDRGIEEESADYLAELYANSPKGQLHQQARPAGGPTPAASCNVGGIIPIF